MAVRHKLEPVVAKAKRLKLRYSRGTVNKPVVFNSQEIFVVSEFAQQYSPMRHDVAASVIDGEAIIMNLTNGAYYSIDAVGAIVWQWLDEEQSTEEILQRLAAQYPDARASLQNDIHALIRQLLEEGLLREGSSENAVATAQSSLPVAYVAPSLQKYTEMADLLALDPPMPSIAQPPAAQR